METAMEVIRWGGLVLALVLTLVVLRQVAIVVRTLSDIRELAARIRDASVRAAEHVKAAEGLVALEDRLGALRRAGGDAADAARGVASRLEGTAAEGPDPRGGEGTRP